MAPAEGGEGVQQQRIVDTAPVARNTTTGKRGRREMRRIEDKTSRLVTFSKRRNGLMKKAFELGLLCDAEVALIVFSPRGRLYEYASASDLQKTIDRYLDHTKGTPANKKALEMCRSETTALKHKIDAIEAYQRKLSGEGLGSCSAQELQELELQLEKSLRRIRERKEQKFLDKILELKEKERELLMESSVLREESMALPLLELATAAAKSSARAEEVPNDDDEEELRQYMKVETELVIGRPWTSSYTTGKSRFPVC